ncbi:uncharacterized protein NDAI_0J01100 [Naumovozyma dairenensis CBS 421]|uniref:3beta-hydroxysteroid 3-dehydrogenase n=1 Tax=Naumovozyma dairenensis (strain ATCC 10597 / BCRC 20456 / CBS 421 / NBRC 0211 / NRRL Y-12639) TaxID=1071378 RepID=G0WGS4_NAUDC|nr:hypothetical protein NDAI_0J01100 [Naumovozyma dairenensis CBS 421]CCD27002.1 hypothetical protein NDAI_0J01100 [Naumovozyma dairenensis CBS 421]
MNEYKVCVVIGANSNLGINIIYRLIEETSKVHDHDNKPVTLTFVISSRTLIRLKEVSQLVKLFITKNKIKNVLVNFNYLLLDLTDMQNIIDAAVYIQQTFDHIDYFFINAAQGVCGGIDWFGAIKELILNPVKAVTDPSYKLQEIGLKSKDGMGLIFQVNVFGPYYLMKQLLRQLSKRNGKVIWISSIRSDSKYLSLQDLELLNTGQPYEGSKREVDLLHLGTYKRLREQGIYQYVTQPGIFISQSFNQFLNFFTYYGMLLMLYLARFFGSPWHTIDGYNAAHAPIYIALASEKTKEKCSPLSQNLKYGSATYRDGSEYIKPQTIDTTALDSVQKFIEDKELEWDLKLKKEIMYSQVESSESCI